MKKLNKSLILACLSLMGSGIPTMATTVSKDSVNDTKKTVRKVKKSCHEINTDRAKYFFDPCYVGLNLSHSIAMFLDKPSKLDKYDKNINLVSGVANTITTTSCLGLRAKANTSNKNLLTGLAPTFVSVGGALLTMPGDMKTNYRSTGKSYDPGETTITMAFCKYIVDIINTVSRANRLEREEQNQN